MKYRLSYSYRDGEPCVSVYDAETLNQRPAIFSICEGGMSFDSLRRAAIHKLKSMPGWGLPKDEIIGPFSV